MKKSLLIPTIGLGLLILFVTSCDLLSGDPEPDTCGQETNFGNYWNGPPNLDAPDLNYLKDGQRHFSWSTPLYEGVCPDKHVQVRAEIDLKTDPLQTVHTRVFSGYGLYEDIIPFEGSIDFDSNTEYRFKGDFGLKQAFPDGPGYFRITVDMYFNTFGNAERDLEYLEEVFKGANCWVYYNYY